MRKLVNSALRPWEGLLSVRLGDGFADPLVLQAGPARGFVNCVGAAGFVEVEAGLVLGHEDRAEVTDRRPLVVELLGS